MILLLLNYLEQMKDRKYSDTSDAFLCDILSKKCNQFLNTYTNPKTQQLLEINQTLKFTTNQVKTTKTIITKNKIVYSNIITQSTIREVALEQTEELKKKEEQLLTELMRHIIQNIKLKIQGILDTTSELTTNKNVFKTIILTLEEEFKSINEELSRVRQYTKRKEIRDVLNLQINSLNANKFVGLIFSSLPKLQEFFIKFEIETLTNQQIQFLKTEIELIDEIVDLDELIEKRVKEKKAKKRMKRKKNKNKVENQTSTNEGGSVLQREQECKENNQYKVAEFLESLIIEGNRSCCHAPDDWLNSLRLKYVH